MRRVSLVALIALLASGCYHATINTGLTPGSQQIDQPWANGFIYGLVPPETVDAMAECGSSGVAVVETEHSFLNALVGAITFGIYTPMHITVTCAQGEQEQGLPEATNADELEEALESGEPFVVKGLNLH